MVELVNNKEIPVEMISQDDTKDVLGKIRNGQIFTVRFVKKDGTERMMNCRRSVNKNQAGGELKYDPAQHGLIPVYDMQLGAYRMINPSTTTEIKTNGKIFIVESL